MEQPRVLKDCMRGTCCAVLCCAVLCCAVLCCAVLCCAVLCCAVLCCAVLCCSGLQALHVEGGDGAATGAKGLHERYLLCCAVSVSGLVVKNLYPCVSVCARVCVQTECDELRSRITALG